MESKKLIAILAAVIIIVIIAAAAVAMTGNEKTATFDLNYDGAESVQVKGAAGAEIMPIPSPERDNLYIEGWYYDKETTKKVQFPYKLTDNVTFYAKWTDSIESYYFNTDYFTSTDIGKITAESMKVTTGYELIDLSDCGKNYMTVSDGYKHAVLYSDNEYKIINTVEKKVVAIVPEEGVLGVFSETCYTFCEEFVTFATNAGYYVYDLKGNCVGPASEDPEIVTYDTLMIGNGYYRFNNGAIYHAFDDAASTMTPLGGENGSYIAMDIMYYGEEEYGLAAYILDSNFRAVNTLTFPAGAQFCNFAMLYDGCFLVQYAVETDPMAMNYSFIYENVKYTLTSTIMNSNPGSNKVVSLDKPIFMGLERNVAAYYGWPAVANDIRDLVLLYNMTPGKLLMTDSVMLASINKDGTIYKVMYEDINKGYSLMDPIRGGGYSGYYTDSLLDIFRLDVVDFSANMPVQVLKGIGNVICDKYFILVDDEGTVSEYVIYDVKGNPVGEFSGMEYIGESNNALYFLKGGDTYRFFDGEMSKLCSGEAIIGSAFYAYENGDGTYGFYTESGKLICTSDNGYYQQNVSSEGKNILEVWKSSGTQTYVLTN